MQARLSAVVTFLFVVHNPFKVAASWSQHNPDFVRVVFFFPPPLLFSHCQQLISFNIFIPLPAVNNHLAVEFLK